MKMVVISKSFTTHKRGEKDEDNQDSININELKGRYALSDGLSRSFLPRLLADTITESFTTDGTISSAILSQKFNKKKEEYLSTLDEDSIVLQELAEEIFKYSSATFVGLELCNLRATWTVLGDSCLFIIPEQGAPQCICSNKVTISEDSQIHVLFGNNTAHIRSDGKVFGNLIKGEADILSSGWYVLMSDAISEWFINRLNEGCNMAPILYQLKDNKEFESFIEGEYQDGRIRSDDCTIVVIRIDNNEDLEDKPDDDYFFSKNNKECKSNDPTIVLDTSDKEESEGQPLRLNNIRIRRCISRLMRRIKIFIKRLVRYFKRRKINNLTEYESSNEKLS